VGCNIYNKLVLFPKRSVTPGGAIKKHDIAGGTMGRWFGRLCIHEECRNIVFRKTCRGNSYFV
jgi:hypothetical protein